MWTIVMPELRKNLDASGHLPESELWMCELINLPLFGFQSLVIGKSVAPYFSSKEMMFS